MFLAEFTRPNRFTPDEKASLSHRTKRLTSDENSMSEFGYSISTKYQTVARKLSKNGWHLLSSGYFSKVYVNPSKDYIIKLNVNRDVGFLWFMFLTRKFPNIHFPKMMDAKILFQEENGKALYAYKIEKLQSLTGDENTREIVMGIGYAIERIANRFFQNIDDYLKSNKNELLLDNYLRRNPSMKEAINVLGKYSKGREIDLVGNSSNFMQRSDGTIVINDPFSNSD